MRDPQNDTDLAEGALSRVILGEVVVLVNEEKNAGSYEEKFDGSGLASGVYFYRLTAGRFAESRKNGFNALTNFQKFNRTQNTFPECSSLRKRPSGMTSTWPKR